MADTKLSALTELATTPASNDEVYIRDVSEAASAESKRITIANLLAGAGATLVRKTADEIVRNSASLQNDDHLVFPVGANEVWEVLLVLRAKRAGTQSIKTAWVLPTGASGERILKYESSAWTAPEDIETSRNTGSMDATTEHIQYRWLYIGGGSAGNVQFQWAQANSEDNDTTIEINSFLTAHRIA